MSTEAMKVAEWLAIEATDADGKIVVPQFAAAARICANHDALVKALDALANYVCPGEGMVNMNDMDGRLKFYDGLRPLRNNAMRAVEQARKKP